MPLPRWRRPPIRSTGQGTVRKLPQRRAAYAAVARRSRGRCELCSADVEARGGRLDPHHVWGRGHLIPAEYCDTPESILGICRECHDRIHAGDAGLRDTARWTCLNRFVELHNIAVGIPSHDPLNDMRQAIRLLEASS